MSKVISISLILISGLLTLISLVHGAGEEILEIGGSITNFIILSLRIEGDGGGWIYEYQTLIAGVFAASSVFLTWYTYSSTLKRKELTARAKLNDPLSVLCSYARDCFESIQNDKENMPQKCAEEIKIINEAIEFLDKNSAEAVFELVSYYQVHNARLEGYYKENPDSIFPRDRAKIERLYDVVMLYCLAVRLFGYARNRDQYDQEVRSVTSKKPSKDDMHSALNQVYGVHRRLMAHQDASLQELINKIDRRHD